MPGHTSPLKHVSTEIGPSSGVAAFLKTPLFLPGPFLLPVFTLAQGEATLVPDLAAFVVRIMLLLVLAFLYLFLALTVHEVGHLIGGWSANFRCIIFAVGPLKIIREEERTRLKWQWDRTAPIGFVLMIPEGEQELPRRWSRMIAAGPIASLLLAIVVTVPAALILPSPVSLLNFLLIMAVMMSWLIAIMSLIPIKTDAAYHTDGGTLLTLLKGGAEADRLGAIHSITASYTKGTRPREWHASLLDTATALEDGAPEQVYADLLYYAYYLDWDRIKQAEKHLEKASAEAGSQSTYLQGTIYATATFHHAYYRRDVGAARECWQRVRNLEELAAMDPVTLLRGKAALNLVEGRFAEARSIATEGISSATRLPYPGLAAAWVEQLKRIIDEAERSRSDIHAAKIDQAPGGWQQDRS